MQTILIIASMAAQRALLARWLHDEYRVVTAADGAAGLALAEHADPDLIFMAQVLPDDEDGEAVHRLQEQARLRDIPLVALTASARPGAPAPMRVAGCVDALEMPLQEERVLAMLSKWLGGG
jgi:CheY-like chemotaxis protein